MIIWIINYLPYYWYYYDLKDNININSKLLIAPKVKIYNDKNSQRPTLIKRNLKTISILCGKLDAAPLVYQKIEKLFRKKI